MTTKITAPVPGLNGLGVGGLQFVDSVAETDNDAVIAYCRSTGYTVEEAGPAFPEGDPSKDWTRDQLKAYAKEKSIDLAGTTTKADMVEAITSAPPAPVKPPADDADITQWADYAIAQGLDQTDIDGKTAEEIRQFIADLVELAKGQD